MASVKSEPISFLTRIRPRSLSSWKKRRRNHRESDRARQPSIPHESPNPWPPRPPSRPELARTQRLSPCLPRRRHFPDRKQLPRIRMRDAARKIRVRFDHDDRRRRHRIESRSRAGNVGASTKRPLEYSRSRRLVRENRFSIEFPKARRLPPEPFLALRSRNQPTDVSSARDSVRRNGPASPPNLRARNGRKGRSRHHHRSLLRDRDPETVGRRPRETRRKIRRATRRGPPRRFRSRSRRYRTG